MQLSWFSYFFILIFSFSIVSAEINSSPKLIKTYSNWAVYTQIQDSRKTCFISTTPIESYGNYTRRSAAYIWVISVSNNIDEVSITVGYPYKKDTHAEMILYTQGIEFQNIKNKIANSAKKGKCSTDSANNPYIFDITDEEQAWVKDIDHDEEIIRNMKKGHYATVSATSPKNTCSIDVYSLVGFSDAYKHMKELCKEK